MGLFDILNILNNKRKQVDVRVYKIQEDGSIEEYFLLGEVVDNYIVLNWMGKKVNLRIDNCFIKTYKSVKGQLVPVYLTIYSNGSFKKPKIDKDGIIQSDGIDVDAVALTLEETEEIYYRYKTAKNRIIEFLKSIVPYVLLFLTGLVIVYAMIQLNDMGNNFTKTIKELQKENQQFQTYVLNTTHNFNKHLDHLYELYSYIYQKETGKSIQTR